MDVNADDNGADAAGWTPHLAVRGGISPRLRPGADLEALNCDGDTALISAVTAGNLASVESLLALGADVNHGDAQGWTPLHIAVVDGFTAIIKLLVQSNADLNAYNPLGQTALISAIHDVDLGTARASCRCASCLQRRMDSSSLCDSCPVHGDCYGPD